MGHGNKSSAAEAALIILDSNNDGNELRVPPFLVLLLACFFNCIANTVFNMVMSHGIIPWKSVWTSDPTTLQGTTPFIGGRQQQQETRGQMMIIPPAMHCVEMGEMSPTSRDTLTEFDPLIPTTSFAAQKHDAAVAAALASRKGPILGVDEVFMKAQMIAFHMNVQFTMLCVLKSLLMVVVVFYHFEVRGGWNRFVVCSAAFLSSGQMTPLIQYVAKYVLPLDVAYFKNERLDEAGGVIKPPASVQASGSGSGPASGGGGHQSSTGAIDLSSLTHNADKKKLPSGVFIVEVLIQLGTFDLHDFETAFFSGSTFVVLTLVVIPPFVMFCIIGILAYCWLFGPVLLLFAQLRRSYYIDLVKRKNAAMSGTTKSPKRIFCEEVARAFLLRFALAALVLWILQTSFLLAVAVWNSGTAQYFHIIIQELEQRLDWGAYWNLVEANRFQRLCLLTQLIF